MLESESGGVVGGGWVVQEEKGGAYTASVPLLQASSPEGDVLLAYEMNEEVSSPLPHLKLALPYAPHLAPIPASGP